MNKNEKKLNIFTILESISFTKIDFSEHEDFNKEYNCFLVLRFLSMNPDTVFYAELMNRNWSINKVNQYHMLLKMIPKKKRYFKYEKGEKHDETERGWIAQYFNVNHNVAADYAQILNETEKKLIKDLVKEIQ